MPTRGEISDLLAIPARPGFVACAANHAITATYVAVSKTDEIEAFWSLLREGFARSWSAYFTAATGDRGIRIGPRLDGRRAGFVAAKLHMTAEGLKLSSNRKFGGFSREKVLLRDRSPSPAFRSYVAALPSGARTAPFFDPVYDHTRMLVATAGLLPRFHPPF